MAIAHPFDYVKPKSLAEAIKIMAKRGDRARIIAGGTDLICLISDGAVKPDLVVDIKGVPGLAGISFKGGKLRLGALTTFTDLLESKLIRDKFPVFAEMAGWVASNGVRNRATMVGNICSAVPCCDSGPILLVYEAKVLLKGPKGSRQVPLEKWFLGPRKTDIRRGEIVVGLELSAPKKKHAACFVKLRRYKGEDLAQASVTVLAVADNTFRIAFGSVAPKPIRGASIERRLKGFPLSEERIKQAVALVPKAVAPITDIRSTKEYRAHMVGVMLERGLRAAASRLEGKGPKYSEELI